MRRLPAVRTVRYDNGVQSRQRSVGRDLRGEVADCRRDENAGRANEPNPWHEQRIDLALETLANAQTDKISLRRREGPPIEISNANHPGMVRAVGHRTARIAAGHR